MNCASTAALNAYMEQEDKRYKAFDDFITTIESDLESISKQTSSLKNIAEDFQGFDFSEELDEELREIL